MSDGEVKEAEVVTALAVKPEGMASLVKDTDQGVFKAMASMASLDWKALQPNQTAVLLMQKTFPASGGGVMTLNFKQALLFAVRCFELGLSPFSDGVWFDPNRSSVNITLSGKKELARIKGIDLGPPKFEELTREWASVARMTDAGREAQKLGFTKDVGIKCTVRVGDPKNNEVSDYTAWLNEWFVSRSPVWVNKPTHMLCTRAHEKVITMVLGTGASAMPDEADLT